MTYVQIQPKGTRLGNWMFQYAAAKSASPQDDISFVIEDMADWPKVEKFKVLFPDVKIIDSAPDGASIRTDLYQDEKYLLSDVVKNLFRCPNDVSALLESKYGDLLDDESLVSIHVRRGDYLGLPHRHPFVGEKYLKEAVYRFNTMPGVKFMVCSDDIPWCRKFFSNNRFPNIKFYFSEGSSVLEDLFLMRRCSGGHICSNSTFSWWGAYGSKDLQPKTIFPSMWYGPAVHTEWRGLYFEGSEVVKNGYSMVMKISVLGHLFKDMCGRFLRKVGLR